ncbi:pyridoxamine 5'-phosphate oxidase [Actinomadura rubrobrunea]|uniref:Pyridoxamine 5'-phosphate oxidase n=1 Tax=Actinomadura rubrobrunea TaxID=115335 RepID=A0A9W6UWP2_9ACTN|nr:pyridoxamine 5'-phosphate oxidase family protein [Actinomadura rubrobrunea]GLW66901.1 pyridoxamine 5'-phosphate oxidase [Actinomadura rubrobrunea]
MPVTDEPILTLDRRTCLALLGGVSIGRVAWADDDGRVTVLPVNFVMDGDAVVFRTSSGAKLAAVARRRPMTFEADDAEPALRTGWSVLVQGPAEIITDVDELRRLESRGLEPWATDAKPYFVRVAARHVTGRRLPLRPGGVHVERSGGDDVQ